MTGVIEILFDEHDYTLALLSVSGITCGQKLAEKMSAAQDRDSSTAEKKISA